MQAHPYMTSLQYLEIIVGYLVCGIVAVFGIVLVWRVASDGSLADLLDDPDSGKASTSRFQLVIFTFVVALSFFLVVVSNVKLRQSGGVVTDTGMPDVPGGVLALLGISASSYLVSRGITKSGNGNGSTFEAKTEVKENTNEPPPAGRI